MENTLLNLLILTPSFVKNSNFTIAHSFEALFMPKGLLNLRKR
jgi:hypothetical protein